VLLLPGFALLKEWAYAGVTFALVMATISNYQSNGGAKGAALPVLLLVLVAVSYFTRPATRRLTSHHYPDIQFESDDRSSEKCGHHDQLG
jgi:hypothetical protein